MKTYSYDPALGVLKACRKAVGRIGLAMMLAFAVSQGVGLGLILWLEKIAPASLENSWVNLGTATLPIYLLGIPLVFLMIRRLPAAYPLEIHPVGVGGTAAFAVSVYGLFYAAQMATLAAVELLSRLTERNYSNALDELTSTTTAATFVIVGLLGPIMEELLFRGLILRRLLPYGRTFAIVTSALMFGLFHGNFFQMGYAFTIGLGLGYITVRTGSMVHAVVMHVCFNTYSSLLAFMLEKNPAAATAGSLVILAAAVVGWVVLFLKRKTIAYHMRPAPVEPERTLLQMLKSPGMWLYALICTAMAIYILIVL